MFDELLKEIEWLSHGVRTQMDMPVDEDEYLDRRCPVSECHADFKVLFEDWKAKVSDEHLYCPICRHDGPSGEWDTPEQEEYIALQAQGYVQGMINDAIEKDTKRFNSQQKPGFVTLSMSYTRDSEPIIVPIEAAKVMRQRFVCDACGCHYAAIGAAFFCRACGHDSAVALFDQTINATQQTITSLASFQQSLAAEYNEDVAKNSVRLILEESLTRLVSAFQHLAEELFKQSPKSAGIKTRRNVFQKLSESSELWKQVTGKGYDDLLSAREIAELELLFQKRHLIAHRNGIVDQEYIDKSGDRAYSPSQRLVIQVETVLRLAELLSKLGAQLRTLV